MAYKLLTLDVDADASYPPEFLACLREHQDLGWNLVFIAFAGDNPMVLFQKAL
jgi:hypothetical protein